jgi:hypothetical protein
MGRAPGDKAERPDRVGGVGDEAALEIGIGPRLGDDAGADVRPDPGLIGVDDEIERLGIDIALLGQDRFEGADPELHLVELGAVVIVMVRVLVDGHGGNLARPVRLDYDLPTGTSGRLRDPPRPRPAFAAHLSAATISLTLWRIMSI